MQKAPELYEYALLTAISACIRAGPRNGSFDASNLAGCKQTSSMAMPRETIKKTGIAPWDAAILDDAQRMAREDEARMHEANKDAGTATVEDGDSPTLASTRGAEGRVGGEVLRGKMEVDADSRGDSGRRGRDRALDTAIVRELGSDGSKDTVEGHTRGSSHEPVAHDAVPHSDRHSAKVRADKSEGAHVENGDRLLEVSQSDTPLRGEARNASKLSLPVLARLQQVGSACKPTRRPEHRGSRVLERALKLATRCLEIDGAHADAYMLRAEIELRLGRKDRSIVDFEAAALLSVGDPRLRINQVMEHTFVEDEEFPTLCHVFCRHETPTE